MESCDNSVNEKVGLRPRSLMGDLSENVEPSHLLQLFLKVKKFRKMGSEKNAVLVREKGRKVIKRVVGLRKRAARRSRYYHSYVRIRSAMGNPYHNCNPSQSHCIYRRLKKLQSLIPGGRKMGVDVLFQETAEYILFLKMQVHFLQTLSNILSTTTNVPHHALGNSLKSVNDS
ncbi:hypothetical protein SUGI_0568970 [Cryptomeria japonica]|uniref:uncharacterized protein LOC131037850 n=1 Tax=Cryptomeria japonica TaxID=3369 RepID=UPI002408DF42|nr:uncharacterized protein LOC131037850 [Cryptomeria japonica]GLJ28866.1 hypothetical protein SUGI_0568970 [Cryptomeria japonica]